MLLTITTTHRPATDLGYLLHKNPARTQIVELTFGKAHIFYPEVGPERCTAALLLDIDPVGLVRGKQGSPRSGPLDQYVNDRPYAASSFLSVALAQVFGTALGGRSKERQSLADSALPLEATISALPCRGGESFLRRLFEPLGYAVDVESHPLDEAFPDWGESRYFTVRLQATCRLQDLLNHIYVLVPVLDNEKHYWVSDDEVEKLLRHGEGWLAGHPEREAIVARYLKYKRSLAREAIARLAPEEPSETEDIATEPEVVLEEKLSLHEQRLKLVVDEMLASAAKRVLDLGCGEGRLLRKLLEERSFESIVGMDVSTRALEMARERLDRLPAHMQQRVKLIQGALTYRDGRLSGFDAAAIVEVVEHLDQPRLAAFERVLFEFTRPNTIVLTTPNREYNVKFEGLAPGSFRHADHRFEWTRAEFESWASRVAERFGYAVRFRPVGPEDPLLGGPCQMAVFTHV